jgi:hypothetical protein
VRSRRRDRGHGKRDGRATLQRRTIVALKRMGPMGRRSDRDFSRIFDPTPSTYPVDWCESWGFRWEDQVAKERFTLKISYEEREG